jgi:hypothetical protein
MTRTKASARHGPEGREYRENSKTSKGRRRNQENKKRKHDERKAAQTNQEHSGSSQRPSIKKNKIKKRPSKEKETEESIQLHSTSPPALGASHDASASSSTDNPQISTELENTHNVTIMNIISSSQIQQKVTRALEILSEFPVVPPAKPKVVMLHVKAPIASKLITIAEITKRELVKGGGKWYQYNKLGQIMEEKKSREGGGKKDEVVGGDVSMADDADGDAGNENDEEFETMKTPFERAIEGKPKVRVIPIMTLYLSRVRIDSLRKDCT